MIFLPGGRGSTSTPVVSQSPGSLQNQPAFAARKEPRKHALECGCDIGVRLGEDPLHPVVDLGDDVEQVFNASYASPPAARTGIGVVPRCATNSSSASGFTRPSRLSSRRATRNRFCCSSRTYGTS